MSTENVAGIGFELTFDGSKLNSKIDAACDKVAAKFEKSFTKAGNSATKAIQSSSDEINRILNDVERSAKSKAAAIAAIYRKQGDSQEDAFKKAWSHIERNSAKSADKVQKSISRISKQSHDTADDLKNNFVSSFAVIAKKAAAVFATAFAAKEIVAFGKECVELGSDLQEVQNVVDVTFTSISKKVDAFAQSAAGSFGLSETMAKRFTGTFGSMAKAFGFSEQQAYDMSTALTGLAGDVASFYNITQDAAYTKLKSVFTGETESLKDLGVVMTQTALDSYALANGFNKTTAAMSEAEKVALRYQFVQDQLSTASGDFERTSGGWANQVRIMNLQLDSIKAKLGQGLIAALTPAIKVINTLLEKLSVLAGTFQAMMEGFFGKEDSGSGGAVDAAASIATSTGQTADNLEKASRFLAGFDKIQKITGQNIAPSSSSISSFDFGLTSIDQSAEAVDKTVGKITATLEKLRSYLDSKLRPIIEKLWFDVIKPCAQRIGKVIEDIGLIMQDFWDKHAEPIFAGLTEAWEKYKQNLKKAWETVIKPIWSKFMEIVDELWDEHFEPFYRKYADFVGKLIEGALRIYNEAFMPMVSWVIDKLGPVFTKELGEIMDEAGDYLGDMVDAAGELLGALDGLIDFIVGTFTGDWELAWQGCVEIFESTFRGLAKLIENPLNAVIDVLNRTLQNIENKINSYISLINNLGVNVPKVDLPEIGHVDVGDDSSNANGNQNPTSDRRGSIGWTSEGASSGGGTSGGGSTATLNNGISKKNFNQISMFAEGAYVKANTPQLAIIGDNMHQGEYVAPEGKLFEMALQAAKAAGGGVTRAELESIVNNAVMRVVSALAGMGFYLDGEQMAAALQTAEQAIDTRFNPVTPA